MFFSVPAIDAYIIMYCNYSREAISNVIHAHLQYILGHFQTKWLMKEVTVSLVGVEWVWKTVCCCGVILRFHPGLGPYSVHRWWLYLSHRGLSRCGGAIGFVRVVKGGYPFCRFGYWGDDFEVDHILQGFLCGILWALFCVQVEQGVQRDLCVWCRCLAYLQLCHMMLGMLFKCYYVTYIGCSGCWFIMVLWRGWFLRCVDFEGWLRHVLSSVMCWMICV